ncbi:MAG: M23 family metallopeptidase [Alphaproteobacteria bacterium]|nr:M23 family metallopeptidase [Alphaproteobacteria bacterium]
MIEKTSTLTGNLLIGCVILFSALIFSSARADETQRKFLPLTSASGGNANSTRQFIPIRSLKREATTIKMIALNGSTANKTWRLSDMKSKATPMQHAMKKEVPDNIKLAMATGRLPRMDDNHTQIPRAGDKQEMIAAALAPVMELHKNAQQAQEDESTDIRDAGKAIAEKLPAAIQDAVDEAIAHVWPVADAHYRISSPYGYRKHPVTGKHSFHAGIDIPAPMGTNVLAAVDGNVAAVGEHPRLGRYVKVTHNDGTYSLYGHLQKWNTQRGKAVKAGDVIGKVGSTGRSTGPHLDFSIRRDGKSFNPMTVLSNILDEKKLALNK